MENNITFHDAFLKYRNELMFYAMKLAKRPELAEELMQDVLVKSLENNVMLHADAARGYIATCILNHYRSIARLTNNTEYRDKIELDTLYTDEVDTIVGSVDMNMEGHLTDNVHIPMVLSAINSLTNSRKYVINEVFKHGSPTKAAKANNVNYNTFKQNYLHAVRDLRKVLC